MIDLTSRQAAIDVLKRNYPSSCFEDLRKAVDIAIKALSAQPEIIRCKDCKHWKEGTVYSYCNKLFGMGVLDVYDYMTEEDDFCSRAEKERMVNDGY